MFLSLSSCFPKYYLSFYLFSCNTVIHSKTRLFQICRAAQGCPQHLWRAYSSIPQSFYSVNVVFHWKLITLGLPWWHSGWESACQCRGHGFGPWSVKIPNAAEQLGPWATTTEPSRLEPVLRNKRGRDSERPTHRDEEWPPLAAARGSPRTETKTQHKQTINN